MNVNVNVNFVRHMRNVTAHEAVTRTETRTQ